MFTTISNSSSSLTPTFGKKEINNNRLVNREYTDTVQFSGWFSEKTPEERIEKNLKKGWTRRRQAMRDAAELPNTHPKKVEYIEQGFTDGDYDVREAAVIAAATLPDKTPVKEMILGYAFNDDKRKVSNAALKIIEEMPNDNLLKLNIISQGLETQHEIVKHKLELIAKRFIEHNKDNTALLMNGLKGLHSGVARFVYKTVMESDNIEFKCQAIELGIFYPDDEVNKLAVWHLSQLPDNLAEPILEKRARINPTQTHHNDDLLGGLLD